MHKTQNSVYSAVQVSPAANLNTGNQSSDAGKGAQITYGITAIDAAQTVQLEVHGIAADGTDFTVYQSPVLNAVSVFVLELYPGAIASGTVGATTLDSLSIVLPYTWYVRELFTDVSGTKPITRSLSYMEVGH